jgi:hypothetical protein
MLFFNVSIHLLPRFPLLLDLPVRLLARRLHLVPSGIVLRLVAMDHRLL